MSPPPANNLAQSASQFPQYLSINTGNIMEGYARGGQGIGQGLASLPAAVLGGLEIAYRAKELKDLDTRLMLQDKVLDLQAKHLMLRNAEADMSLKLETWRQQREKAGLEAEMSQIAIPLPDGNFKVWDVAGEEGPAPRTVGPGDPRVRRHVESQEVAQKKAFYEMRAEAQRGAPDVSRSGVAGRMANIQQVMTEALKAKFDVLQSMANKTGEIDPDESAKAFKQIDEARDKYIQDLKGQKTSPLQSYLDVSPTQQLLPQKILKGDPSLTMDKLDQAITVMFEELRKLPKYKDYDDAQLVDLILFEWDLKINGPGR